MDSLQFDRIMRELNSMGLRLIHAESTNLEKADEMIEVVSSIANEIRDLKAELVALGDILVALENKAARA